MLLGTHTYACPDMHDLPGVRGNVERLTELLRDPTVWGLPHGHCLPLLQPGRGALLDAVHDAVAGAEDTLLVYFAGHGLIHPGTGELYLALPDADDERLDKALRYEDLRDKLVTGVRGRVPPRRKVVVLDCCWSGRALNGFMSGQGPAALAEAVGTYVLTSTSETRQAVAPEGAPYTAFTGELITALAEGLPDESGHLSMTALYRHLAGALRARSLPLPQQSNRNAAGDIRLFRNRARRTEAVPVPPSPGPVPGRTRTALRPAVAKTVLPRRTPHTPIASTAPAGPDRPLPVPLPGLLPVPAADGCPEVLLGKHLVTNVQYRAFLKDPANAHWRPGAAPAPDVLADGGYLRGWKGEDFPEGTGRLPVVAVGVPAARAYAAWMGRLTGRPVRLPTPQEWSRAAAAGRPGDWVSEDVSAGRVNFRGTYGQPAAVGAFHPNPYGFCDLLGNVWEICVTRAGTPTLRGGAHDTPRVRLLDHVTPASSAPCRGDVGFRVACDN
ncbi:SUMF1/EgtB/PvdO family nonheme iron enzyme [Streptomyces chrestomyceticus]|uniref:caspase, EACC1-associated type n=1 Tax=Streptomyces chrestomyceticus TaxID=68185 RepID=UPI00368652E4